MVRKRMIRIAAWLLIGILCAGSIPMTTKAEEPLHILALGDSIALGYGLEDKEQEAYGAVLAKKAGAKFTNEGINGLRSEDLIGRLEAGEYDEQIKDADIILLSIGSNDVLKNCVIQAADLSGVESEIFRASGRDDGNVSRSAKSQTGASGESGSIRYMRSV